MSDPSDVPVGCKMHVPPRQQRHHRKTEPIQESADYINRDFLHENCLINSNNSPVDYSDCTYN